MAVVALEHRSDAPISRSAVRAAVFRCHDKLGHEHVGGGNVHVRRKRAELMCLSGYHRDQY
jgi:hypothetical protein